jgi:hypothetical protein
VWGNKFFSGERETNVSTSLNQSVGGLCITEAWQRAYTVVASNDKYYSRIKVLETFIGTISAKLNERGGGNGTPRK